VVVATALLAGSATAQEEVPQGGTIVVGEWQTATQLNTFMSNSLKDQEPAWIISRPLVIIDDQGQYIPEFLTEVPSVENGGLVADEDGDGFTLNLKMKEGLLWSDGTPFTLHDFKALYDWAVEVNKDGSVGCVYCLSFVPTIDPSLEGEALFAPENQYVESITVSEDGLSAEIKFRTNFSAWMNALLFQPLIAPHYWAEVPIDELETRAVPGSPSLLEIPTNGPFVVAAASSDGIDFSPNPNWTADTGPNLDQVRLRFFGDKAGMFASFLNGEIDLTLNTSPGDLPALQVVDPSIGSVLTDQGWLYEHLDFNTERTDLGLDDPAVRQALRMAIDKQALLDVLFPGAGLVPACSITHPALYYAEALPCVAYDPKAAAAALDAAGWTMDPEQGARVKDGNVMRFKMCTSSGNPIRLTTLGRISQDFLAVGVPTDIQTSGQMFDPYLQAEGVECNIYRGTFDVTLYTSQVTGDPYGDYYAQYHSDRIPSDTLPGGGNISRLADPETDAILLDLSSQLDEEAVVDASFAIQERIDELANEIPLYYRFEPLGVSTRFGGFKNNPSTATKLWDVYNWYVLG
jgi:peptide/nickel transport system substrate-binding protein